MRGLWHVIGQACLDENFSNELSQGSSPASGDALTHPGANIYAVVKGFVGGAYPVSRYEVGEVNRVFKKQTFLDAIQPLRDSLPFANDVSEDLKLLIGICCIDKKVNKGLKNAATAAAFIDVITANGFKIPVEVEPFRTYFQQHHNLFTVVDLNGWKRPGLGVCDSGVTYDITHRHLDPTQPWTLIPKPLAAVT